MSASATVDQSGEEKILPWSTEILLVVFVVFNLWATTGDVVIAHSFNKFGLWTQWIPLLVGFFAGTIAAVSGFGSLNQNHTGNRTAFLIAMGMSVALGVVGTVLHTWCDHCPGISLKNLVYSAPLAAPLAYSGVAMVGVLAVARREQLWGLTKRQGLYVLVAMGSLANAALCILDHARNAFFHPTEWLSIVVALFTTSIWVYAAVKKKLSASDRAVMWVSLALQAITGLAGWGFHPDRQLLSSPGHMASEDHLWATCSGASAIRKLGRSGSTAPDF